MQEAGLAPSHLVCTSMGAVFGALFAAGLSPAEGLDRATAAGESRIVQTDRVALLRGLWARSLLKPAPFRRELARMVPARSFDELRLRLTVTAVDLDTGELLLFGAGGQSAPLLDALYASAALPLFLPPAVIMGRRCADGGLRATLPLEPAACIPAGLVVAVDVGPGFDEPAAPAATYPPLVAVHDASTGVLMAALTAAELARWRAEPGRPELVYVRPRVDRSATFRVERAAEYAAEGHRATGAALAARGDRPRS
jgi:NTE family protein